jgi:Holliday junction DNA helicase RuvA
MIGRLRGTVLEKQPPDLLIDVQGVAYEVQASMQSFYQLPLNPSEEVILYTHMVVREDAHQLFGFYAKEERALFRTLLKVNGIGPKSGLSILSSISPEEFRRCVNFGDTASLTKVPGIGKKTAERLMIELRDREFIVSGPVGGGIHQDALSALLALGYKSPEAIRALEGLDAKQCSREEMIRIALKRMNV